LLTLELDILISGIVRVLRPLCARVGAV
jgi:hypothetical protein